MNNDILVRMNDILTKEQRFTRGLHNLAEMAMRYHTGFHEYAYLIECLVGKEVLTEEQQQELRDVWNEEFYERNKHLA